MALVAKPDPWPTQPSWPAAGAVKGAGAPFGHWN